MNSFVPRPFTGAHPIDGAKKSKDHQVERRERQKHSVRQRLCDQERISYQHCEDCSVVEYHERMQFPAMAQPAQEINQHGTAPAQLLRPVLAKRIGYKSPADGLM